MYQTAFLFCLLQPAGGDEGQGTGATPTMPWVPFVVRSDNFCIMLPFVSDRLNKIWLGRGDKEGLGIVCWVRQSSEQRLKSAQQPIPRRTNSGGR